MINTKDELRELIQLEKNLWIKRNYPTTRPKHVRSKEILFVSALRHVEYYSDKRGIGKLGGYYWKVLYKLLGTIYNVMIPINVFGKGLLIQHLQNIVISAETKVGDYCCLFHGVTLGIALGKNDSGKCPTLGNGVTICTGAGIFGNVKIADGIMVAANAIVTKSFNEQNTIIGGVPAKIISKEVEWSMLEFKNCVNN